MTFIITCRKCSKDFTFDKEDQLHNMLKNLPVMRRQKTVAFVFTCPHCGTKGEVTYDDLEPFIEF